jgi:anthranilate synthase component II
MKILIIDNYDSFTYNLVQYLREITEDAIDVFRNDQIALGEIEKYDAVVLSPGPGLPKDAGIILDIIKEYGSHKPILGICLGHQAIAEAFGGSLVNLKKVFHGIATPVSVLNKEGIFKNQEDEITAGRYHSWIADKNSLPDCLQITAEDETGQIMAMKHRQFNVTGLQFHPESILTPKGKDLLKNFISDVSTHLSIQKTVTTTGQ